MKRAFTLIEIMIVVAIIALLAGLGIPNLLRARVNAIEANAQAILKTISTACETYALANSGRYPTTIGALTGSVPAYINEDYTSGSRHGYTYGCTLTSISYVCTASPSTLAGARTYRITTGGVLSF